MKVALVCTSGMKRLAAHAGSLKCYFEEEKAGKAPHPHFVTGASAGAIASAVFAPWTEKNFKKQSGNIELPEIKLFNGELIEKRKGIDQANLVLGNSIFPDYF